MMPAMFIRPCFRHKNGKRHAYWALVESVRTERGPRQRVVAYVGGAPERRRRGVWRVAEGKPPAAQERLFESPEARRIESNDAEWVEIDAKRVRVENARAFGGPWLALELARQLGLDAFLKRALGAGREDVPWPLAALALVVARLCEPSSELQIAERFYAATALSDLLGVPAQKINDDRLYRALDALLPHKPALETFLKDRLGSLFSIEYDLLLYDVTSTYFEGQAPRNPKAQRGYSRDGRPDCKQVCIALVVTKEGLPLGYEVFPGNRHDAKTVRRIVETMEARYGRADRVWVMDRGMASPDTLAFLRDGRRYILGAPKASLRRCERQLLAADWTRVREGLDVKLAPSPDGNETFILCRSRDRREKERAMRARFEERMTAGLRHIAQQCAKHRRAAERVREQVARLRERNRRASRLFETTVDAGPDGRAVLTWRVNEDWRAWAELSEGCYLLRSNVANWTAEELWRAYIHLTDAEAAFRIQKSDLSIRPIWHQREDRVDAHILVCFLAFILWKTLGQLVKGAGLGDEPRRVFQSLAEIRAVDVVLPTRQGPVIRKRCVTRPTDHQSILLSRLNLTLPTHLRQIEM